VFPATYFAFALVIEESHPWRILQAQKMTKAKGRMTAPPNRVISKRIIAFQWDANFILA
jgi:hypothetical protein